MDTCNTVERFKANGLVYRQRTLGVIAGLDANRAAGNPINRLPNRAEGGGVRTILRSEILPIHKHDAWLQNPRCVWTSPGAAEQDHLFQSRIVGHGGVGSRTAKVV